MRQGLIKRILPVSLDDNPRHALRFTLPDGEDMRRPICDLVEEYEKTILRTKPGRSQLVERSVLESERLFARHLPICPSPERHELLPTDNIDCVASTVEFDVSAWSYACYVLRIQGNAGLITAEVYLSAAPRAAGMIAMRFKDAGHLISSMGTGSSGSEYRNKNPDAPSKVEHQGAKEKGERILHFVENALDAASSTLQERSAQARIAALKANRATPKPLVSTIVPSEEVEESGSAGKKKIKRRGDEL